MACHSTTAEHSPLPQAEHSPFLGQLTLLCEDCSDPYSQSSTLCHDAEHSLQHHGMSCLHAVTAHMKHYSSNYTSITT